MKTLQLLLLFCFLAFTKGEAAPIRVLVWDEQQPAQKSVYTNFLGNQIAEHLKKNPNLQVKSANINEPELGLSATTLDQTDVLIWWGHVRHDDIPQKVGDAIVERIKAGKLAMIALHSAHWAVPFRTAMEARLIQETVKMLPVTERSKFTSEFIQWRSYSVPSRAEKASFDIRIDRRNDGTWHLLMERPSAVFPACCTPVQPSTIRTLLPNHPISKEIPKSFTLPQTEMYDEPFHVPEPDEVIFHESWAGGEQFRSGMIWKIGRGHVFYFRPGHETYNVYLQPQPLKIVENACTYLGDRVHQVAARPNLKGAVKKALVFSKTSWYRHPAIPMINDWLVGMANDYGFPIDVTEDSEKFTPENLKQYDLVILVSTTDIGKSLNDQQKKAFQEWFRAGNGIFAMHAAGVHHNTWDWYTLLFGADFNSDSEYVPAQVNVDASAMNHPITKGLPKAFSLDGDWLNYTRSVRDLPGVQILLTLDEKSYDPVRPLFKQQGGKSMGADHPMAWIRNFEGGRFAYTMIGHDTRPLETEFGETHVSRLIEWASSEGKP